MGRTRVVASGFAASLLISLVPAAAIGASNSVSVSGPTSVKALHSPTYVIKGQSVGVKGLAVYTDTSPCSRKVRKEQQRASSSSPTVFTLLGGNFHHSVTVNHSKVGSHYICAYVYHSDSKGHFVTDAHAGIHYQTH